MVEPYATESIWTLLHIGCVTMLMQVDKRPISTVQYVASR